MFALSERELKFKKSHEQILCSLLINFENMTQSQKCSVVHPGDMMKVVHIRIVHDFAIAQITVRIEV